MRRGLALGTPAKAGRSAGAISRALVGQCVLRVFIVGNDVLLDDAVTSSQAEEFACLCVPVNSSTQASGTYEITSSSSIRHQSLLLSRSPVLQR